ncbi:MAG: transhydrogenase subunit alpha, partial [Steroidobacteraceae bacterium]|nr:transhydrogenase subunit alpha [Steroidobacteraceae bacterium]
VAGLQAIATARRLGAVVEAYDVRSATREQVKSLGAKFVETGVSADGAGGYARELTAEEKTKQQEALDARIAAVDTVISTASVPGRKAPVIISKAAVERMRAGSVIVDIAAEQGGNCELTKAGETVVTANGVKVIGPTTPARCTRAISSTSSNRRSTRAASSTSIGRMKFSPAQCSRTTASSNTKPPAKRWKVKQT